MFKITEVAVIIIIIIIIMQNRLWGKIFAKYETVIFIRLVLNKKKRSFDQRIKGLIVLNTVKFSSDYEELRFYGFFSENTLT